MLTSLLCFKAFYVTNGKLFLFFLSSFEFRLRVVLATDGDLMLISRVRNVDGKPFSFSFAYHTYLSVSDIRYGVFPFELQTKRKIQGHISRGRNTFTRVKRMKEQQAVQLLALCKPQVDRITLYFKTVSIYE